MGVRHTLRLRAVGVGACRGDPLPAANLSWFEWDPPPGAVAITYGPTPVSPSAFGTFTLVSSSAPGSATFACALDGGPWGACGSPVRVGLLAAGSHTLRVRTEAAAWPARAPSAVPGASAGPGPAVNLSWVVAPSYGSTVLVPVLADGRHTLQVVSRLDLGGGLGWALEQAPRSLVWVVDTSAPTTHASRLTPSSTNATSGWARVACSDGAGVGLGLAPAPCLFCFRVAVDGQGVRPRDAATCAAGDPLELPVPWDGDVTATVWAVDPAGNVGSAVLLQWARDTQPPRTAARVVGPPGVGWWRAGDLGVVELTLPSTLARSAVVATVPTPYTLVNVSASEAV
jgi:hypothetical protein